MTLDFGSLFLYRITHKEERDEKLPLRGGGPLF
jgi:hypothetical protein